MATKKTSKKAKAPLSRSLRIYQKASILFVVLSSLLLLAVLYLSISRATIHITPAVQTVDQQVEVTVLSDPQNEGEISGYVLKDRFTKVMTIEVGGGDGSEAIPAKASGVITLKNETSSPQPLVATTRLLSEDGVLFRMIDGATVPANGKVEVAVAADVEGEGGNIGATSFTIPGLLAIKQDTIYGVSSSSMKGGLQFVREVSQADVDAAYSELEEAILADALEDLASRIPTGDFDGTATLIDSVSRESTVQPGEEAGVYTVTATFDVTSVFYDTEVVSSYVENALLSSLGDSLEIVAVDTNELAASIVSASVEEEQATITIEISGTSVLSARSEDLRAERFAGKSEREVVALVSALDTVESAEVSFTPFWLKRMPTLKDHIEIKIKKQK